MPAAILVTGVLCLMALVGLLVCLLRLIDNLHHRLVRLEALVLRLLDERTLD